MVHQVTKGIKISVKTSYDSTFYDNGSLQFAFSYRILVENQSQDTVQLIGRHWRILDALNNLETVSGEGVIGKTPVIEPGCSHRYKSGCVLVSPFGAMSGFYNMVNLVTNTVFKVDIPAFKLSTPFAMN